MRELIEASPFSGDRIKFCPECGGNLEIFQIAFGMAEKAQENSR